MPESKNNYYETLHKKAVFSCKLNNKYFYLTNFRLINNLSSKIFQEVIFEESKQLQYHC